jgi:hypothetical protein
VTHNNSAQTVENLTCLPETRSKSGIEMASYLGRADEITEKHRQMAALALRHFVWVAVAELPRRGDYYEDLLSIGKIFHVCSA